MNKTVIKTIRVMIHELEHLVAYIKNNTDPTDPTVPLGMSNEVIRSLKLMPDPELPKYNCYQLESWDTHSSTTWVIRNGELDALYRDLVVCIAEGIAENVMHAMMQVNRDKEKT